MTDAFGPRILLQLNLAFYLPSLPLLAAADRWDAPFNQKYGEKRSTTGRLLAGFGGGALVLATLPWHGDTRAWLLGATAVLGVCCSSAMNVSTQLAAMQAGGASGALALGFVMSAPLVLAAKVAFR